jgi:hypothetical protein
LESADYNEGNSYCDLNPMRPYRSLPIAAGRLALKLAAWIWAAGHNYLDERELSTGS